MWLYMAGGRGVEPHPVSENLVFKASRRTNPAALPPKGTNLMHLVFRFMYAHNTYCAAVYSFVSAFSVLAACSFSSRVITSSEVIQRSRLLSIL